MTLVYNLPLNFKVFIQCKSGNWIRPYHLLTVKNKTYYIQLPSGLTSFKSISVKPYFRPKNIYDIKLDELKVTAKLDKIEVPLPTSKAPQKPIKPAKPAIKQS